MGTVDLLLSLGADPHLYGKWGRVQGTALGFAKQKKFKALVELIERYEALEEEEDREDCTEGDEYIINSILGF